MEEEWRLVNAPYLPVNPFHTRPLEPGQSDLLVGYQNLSAKWVRYLHQKDSRLILLRGQRGSGRTSLLRCLTEESDVAVHLEMYPDKEPSQAILHEIYATLVDFNLPINRHDLVHRLVRKVTEMEHTIPLICLDYSEIPGQELSSLLTQLSVVFMRLPALVIVTSTNEQYDVLSDSVKERFDHIESLEPFNQEMLSELVTKRIEPLINFAWNPPSEFTTRMISETSGNVGKCIRLLREIFDKQDFQHLDARQMEPNDASFPLSEEEIPVFEPNLLPEENHDLPDVIEVQKPTQSKEFFELDLSENKDETSSFKQEIPLPMGGFRGLVMRNRDYNPKLSTEDKTQKQIIPSTKSNLEDGGAEFWSAEGVELLSDDEIKQEQIEHLHHADFQESPPQIQPAEIPSPSYEKEDSGNLKNELADLIARASKSSLHELLSLLRAPMVGKRESHPLNVGVLRNLNKSETILIEVTSQRSISPSDTRMLDRLGVKRARLSQICNRLLRAGILEVNTKEKSRFFSLSRDAKVQLIAWGLMEADI